MSRPSDVYEVSIMDVMYDEEEKESLRDPAAKTSFDALVICLNNKNGEVDMKYMRDISGIPTEQLIMDLRGKMIVQDPNKLRHDPSWNPEKGWVLLSRYLEGPLKKKQAIAGQMNRKFPGKFDCNMEILEEALPGVVDIEDVRISVGDTWIPDEYFGEFMRDKLRLDFTPTVFFSKKGCEYKVVIPDSKQGELKWSVLNNSTYGTHKMSFINIMRYTLNGRTVKVYKDSDGVYDKYGAPVRIIDQAETEAAQEKQNLCRQMFREWVLSDRTRRRLLQECYNERFCGYGRISYDGSILMLPGLNPNITFRKHQKDTLARILMSDSNLVVAHDVGTGKMYIMVGATHELKRMGLSNKNLVVVPKQMLSDTVAAHRYLYPQDNILCVTSEDFTPDKRNSVLEAIRDGDYTAIYMAHSTFDLITMSKKYWGDKMASEIVDLRREARNSIYPQERRMLEKRADRLAEEMAEKLEKIKESGFLSFDELGIETLFVDEAHHYRNAKVETRADNFAYRSRAESKKCREMVGKCDASKRCIFFTATILVNSISDLFVFQKYLQPEELRFAEVDHFDMWVNTFGETSVEPEVDVDANTLRMVTRVSRFHNLPELRGLFSSVCDYYDGDDTTDELPKFSGYTDVLVPITPAEEAYMRSLSERAENIRARKVPLTEDNLLKVTTDGRKCALDIRLVGGEYDGGGKIEACAGKVMEFYRNYPGRSQVVFCDIGTPKQGFNVYDCLRDRLVQLGIPRKEIRFVHEAETEAERSRLFESVNNAETRVIIGSTQKLGEGVNIQKNLVALHHLSVPWRPSDILQRDGRGRRRGNRCPEVFILRYIKEHSYDSYSYQKLETKQRFIVDFFTGTRVGRDAEDIDGTVLSYAEAKALAIGNPLVKRRVEVSNRLERTRIRSRQRHKQLIDLRAVIDGTPGKIAELERLVRLTRKDMTVNEAERESIPNDERIAFGEELILAVKDNVMQESDRFFDEYRGFSVILPANMTEAHPHVYLSSPNGSRYYLEMDTQKPLGCSKSIDYFLDHLCDRMQSLKQQIAKIRERCDDAAADFETGNPYLDEIKALEAELEELDRMIESEDIKNAS